MRGSRRQNDAAFISEASLWLNRILSIVLQMIVPALFGHWLDRRWGTSYLALVGLAIGMPLAIWSLVRLAKTPAASFRNPRQGDDGTAPDDSSTGEGRP